MQLHSSAALIRMYPFTYKQITPPAVIGNEEVTGMGIREYHLTSIHLYTGDCRSRCRKAKRIFADCIQSDYHGFRHRN